MQISLDTWDIRKSQLKTTVNSKISQWESRMRKRDTEISRLRINDPLLRRHKNNHSKSIRAENLVRIVQNPHDGYFKNIPKEIKVDLAQPILRPEDANNSKDANPSPPRPRTFNTCDRS